MSNRLNVAPNDLSAFWMPFTANRQFKQSPRMLVSAKDMHYTASDGRKILDGTAGLWCVNAGHCRPKITEAIQRQAATLMHVSNLYGSPQGEALAQRLVELTFADTVFVTNSGTEAAELAIKMVRKYWHSKGQPGRFEILTFEGAFHGRSTGAIAAAGSEKMTAGYGPLMPGFRVLPWGDMEALEAAMSDSTAAVMLEPVASVHLYILTPELPEVSGCASMPMSIRTSSKFMPG